MAIVKKAPAKLSSHALCPGCGHGIVLRLIEEVIEELHQENNQIVIAGVGCVCTATPSMHFDRFQAAHGRAAATAEGVKRVRPNVLVFAYAAANKGLDAVWLPSYGPTMRGGKANCTVKFAEVEGERVGSPSMEEADALIAMNEPSLDYLEFCKPNCQVFVNANAVSKDYAYPEGVTVTRLDVVDIANKLNNLRAQNLVMLGAVIKKMGIFDEDYAEQAMCKMFADKGEAKFNDANVLAMRAGFDAV